MKLESYRKQRGLTQQEAATELGLRSKGYFSRLESGKDEMPLRLALRIQAWSGGQVPAAETCPKAAALIGQISRDQAAP
ncbi:MAG TPA: helix-turn-helix transcriptional regulator [Caulobacteraceae bacterium]|jgi:transcriptional regulator with XRE-family HTH domain